MAKPKTIKPLPKKQRPTNKYNYPALHTEFMESVFSEVKPFFENKYGKFTSPMAHAAGGWGKEKKAAQLLFYQQALDRFKKKRGKSIDAMLDNLLFVLETVVDNMVNGRIIDADQLKKIWEMVRTEAGLPTRVTTQTISMTGFDFDRARDDLDKDASTTKPNAARGKGAKNLPRPTTTKKPTA